MYGHRARIGYCSPPFVTEVFAYEFYKMVPDGVTLMITTLEVGNEYTQQAFDGSYDRSLAAARAMGEAGADVVVLGGNPVNQSRGIENLPKICAVLAAEGGTSKAPFLHNFALFSRGPLSQALWTPERSRETRCAQGPRGVCQKNAFFLALF